MKRPAFFLTALFAGAFLFVSCNTDASGTTARTYTLNGISFTLEEEPATYFHEYNTFLANKDSWTEPDSYSFVYNWCWGDSFVPYPLKVTVKNGNSTYKVYGDAEDAERIIASYDEMDAKFPTITAIYDYIQTYYEKVKAFSEGKDYFSIFVAKYDDLEGHGAYPSLFDEFQDSTEEKGENVVGYGGAYLTISEITVE